MHLDLNRLKENSHMILIEFIGLDQYLVGDLSKILTKPLANVFETSPDEINFYAPNAQIYHEGIEQTSWYSVVRVFLPEKYHPFEEQAAKILIEEVKHLIINIRIEFHYFNEHHTYFHRNEEFPLFMKDNIQVEIEDEAMLEEENDDDEIYEGNVFDGVLDDEDE